MRVLALTVIFLLSMHGRGEAQILDRLGKKVENKVKQRVDRKVDKAVDKGLDKVEEKIDKSTKGGVSSTTVKGKTSSDPNVMSSNYDFIPGDQLLFYDDFSNTAYGDFPSKWNTTVGGKVVKFSNLTGNWFMVGDNALSFPLLKGSLPQNFTVEFDLYYPDNAVRPPVTFGFSEVANPAKQSIQRKKLFYFVIPKSNNVENVVGYTTNMYSGHETFTEWDVRGHTGKVVHVSIAVNGERIRLYMDTEKLFDLPKAFDNSAYRNNFHLRAAEVIPKPKDGFYVSNVRIAAVSKDLSAALIGEGKLVVSGIHFDSGSDRIKAVSYNILNEIGLLMQHNPSAKFEIVGHTDSDGGAQLNQRLSLQRAEAVRQYLMKNFNISASQLVAIGKEASEPVASNATAEGKAQNRRVEFIRK